MGGPFSRLFSYVSRSPWMAIGAGIWVQTINGGMNDFSIYSQSIKDSLQLTQEALDSISTAKDVGGGFGVISGLMVDHFRTWIVFACAAVLNLIGNLMMWLSITYRVPSPPLWLACVYQLLAANSATFTLSAVLITSIKIIPTRRGTIVGVMKGFLGIGGAILVQIYLATFEGLEEDFLLMMACLGTAVCVVAMFFIRPLPPVVKAEETKWLNTFILTVVLLAVYLLAIIVIDSIVSLGKQVRIIVVCGMVMFLLVPLWPVFRADPNIDESGMCVECEKDGYVSLSEGTNADEEANESLDNLNEVDESNMCERGDDINLFQAMCTLDFWLLFVLTACGLGSGLTVLNNMSQVGSSLGYSTSEISTFVSLWSIWNFLGGFGAGYISDFLFQAKGLPRPTFLSVTLGGMALGHLIIALAFSNALYIGPVLVGTCYGAQWSLTPIIVSEIFGLKSFGAVFNTIAVACPVGTFFLSVKVTGYFYDKEAKRQAQGFVSYVLSESLSCYGKYCFRLSFATMAGVCMLGACVGVKFVLRTRQLYRVLHQEIT